MQDSDIRFYRRITIYLSKSIRTRDEITLRRKIKINIINNLSEYLWVWINKKVEKFSGTK